MDMTDTGEVLPAGTRLEEFVIERFLGEGGLRGDVSGARRVAGCAACAEGVSAAGTGRRGGGTGRSRRAPARDQDYAWGLERFVSEARILARFDHRNLVRVYRVFEARGTAYMVTEYVAGRTLKAEVAAHGPLSEPRMREVLAALSGRPGGGARGRPAAPGHQAGQRDVARGRDAGADRLRICAAGDGAAHAGDDGGSDARVRADRAVQREGPAGSVHGHLRAGGAGLLGVEREGAGRRYRPRAAAARASSGVIGGAGSCERGAGVGGGRGAGGASGGSAAESGRSGAGAGRRGPRRRLLRRRHTTRCLRRCRLARGPRGPTLRRRPAWGSWRYWWRCRCLRPGRRPAPRRAAVGRPGVNRAPALPMIRSGRTPSLTRPHLRRRTPSRTRPRRPKWRPASVWTMGRGGRCRWRWPRRVSIRESRTGCSDPGRGPQIRLWQAAEGLDPTGYLDAGQLVALRETDSPAGDPPSPPSRSGIDSFATADQEPVRIRGDIPSPVKVHDVAPVYPAIAQAAYVQGVVILEATISPIGEIVDVKVLRSVPLLDEAAIEAVRQWRVHADCTERCAGTNPHDCVGQLSIAVVAM